VLDVARLDDNYVLRVVVAAEDLRPNEGVFVGRVFDVWNPGRQGDAGAASVAAPPGPPVDVGGAVRIFDSGFDPILFRRSGSRSPLAGWITLTIAAGIPASPTIPVGAAGPSDRGTRGALVGSPPGPAPSGSGGGNARRSAAGRSSMSGRNEMTGGPPLSDHLTWQAWRPRT
jgi:hypothetical protein